MHAPGEHANVLFLAPLGIDDSAAGIACPGVAGRRRIQQFSRNAREVAMNFAELRDGGKSVVIGVEVVHVLANNSCCGSVSGSDAEDSAKAISSSSRTLIL